MELLSTETKTAEIKTPRRSLVETSTRSDVAPLELKPGLQHPRTLRPPGGVRRGSSNPLATCQLCSRPSNAGLQMPISSSPEYTVSKDFYPALYPGSRLLLTRISNFRNGAVREPPLHGYALMQD